MSKRALMDGVRRISGRRGVRVGGRAMHGTCDAWLSLHVRSASSRNVYNKQGLATGVWLLRGPNAASATRGCHPRHGRHGPELGRSRAAHREAA